MLTVGVEAPQADQEYATLFPGVRRLGVAFSGGVDSSVLLALAVRALGPDSVIAILGVSPASPPMNAGRLTTSPRSSARELSR